MGEEEERSNLEIGSDQDQEEEKGEHQVVKFLDSVDSYLTLFESLSTTLRQVKNPKPSEDLVTPLLILGAIDYSFTSWFEIPIFMN